MPYLLLFAFELVKISMSHIQRRTNLRYLSSILCLSLVGCASVEPGYVGIKVNQYGNQRGVEDFPIKVGAVWYNPITETVYKFPTFMQTVTWTHNAQPDKSITFQSIEGAVVNADIGLSYSIDPIHVPAIFVEFRQCEDHITNIYLRSQIRDCINRHSSKIPVVDIFGPGKEKLLDNVRKELEHKLGPKGFRFDTISFVGGLRVDDRVAASINSVIEANQRAIEAENRVRQSEAEARQKIAQADGEAKSLLTVANSQAEANRVLAASITPEFIQYKLLEKWNGNAPQVLGGQGVTPFFQVQPQK